MSFSFFGLFVTVTFENAIYFSFHEILMTFSPLYSYLALGIAPSTSMPGSSGTQRVVQPVTICSSLFLLASLCVAENMDSHIQHFYTYSLLQTMKALIANCCCLFCMLFLYVCWRQPGENQIAIDKMG